MHTLKILSGFADVLLVCLKRGWERSAFQHRLPDGIETRFFPISKRQVMAAGGLAAITGRPFQALRFDVPGLRDFVNEQLYYFNPDIFWGYQISSYPFLSQARSPVRILDLVDSPSRFADMTAGIKGDSLRTRAVNRVNWRIREYERRAVEASSMVLVSSPGDREHLVSRYGMESKVSIFPNCVPKTMLDHRWRYDGDRPPRLLFVGNLNYPPNRDAVSYFASKVMPRVSEESPEAEFIVCGASGEALASRFAGMPGVRFTGFIEDLESAYLDASMLVTPLSVATGSQYKVLEAMALGLPVLASDVVAKGCGAEPGRDIMVAGSPDEYLSAIRRLTGDPVFSGNLADAGRQLVSANFIWESQADRLRDAIAGVRSAGR
ncbi:MAG: glycosyltransferase [Actinobacteria bacterium]|nr:glycosyltransferase [Actinomycetota bacterium]